MEGEEKKQMRDEHENLDDEGHSSCQRTSNISWRDKTGRVHIG